jgi:hypothetical protein
MRDSERQPAERCAVTHGEIIGDTHSRATSIDVHHAHHEDTRALDDSRRSIPQEHSNPPHAHPPLSPLSPLSAGAAAKCGASPAFEARDINPFDGRIERSLDARSHTCASASMRSARAKMCHRCPDSSSGVLP